MSPLQGFIQLAFCPWVYTGLHPWLQHVTPFGVKVSAIRLPPAATCGHGFAAKTLQLQNSRASAFLRVMWCSLARRACIGDGLALGLSSFHGKKILSFGHFVLLANLKKAGYPRLKAPKRLSLRILNQS